MSLIFDSLKSLDETGPVTMVQAPSIELKWHEKVKRRGELSMSLILIAVAAISFVTWSPLFNFFVRGDVELVSDKTTEKKFSENDGFYEDSKSEEDQSGNFLTVNAINTLTIQHDSKNKNTSGENYDKKVFDVLVKASGKAGISVAPPTSTQEGSIETIKKQTSIVGQTELNGPEVPKPDQTKRRSLNSSVETTEMNRKEERQLIEQLRQKMLVALSSNNHADAEDALISLTEMLGEISPFVQKMSAFFYLETKQYENALEVYQRILIKDTQDNNVRMQIAKVAAVLGKAEVARKQLILLADQREYRSEARQLLQEIRNLSDVE